MFTEYVRQITAHLLTIRSSCSTKPQLYGAPIFKNLSNGPQPSARLSFNVSSREDKPRGKDDRRWFLISSLDDIVDSLNQFVEDKNIPVNIKWKGMHSEGLEVTAEIEIEQKMTIKDAMEYTKYDPDSISLDKIEELEALIEKYDVEPNDDPVIECCIAEIIEFVNRAASV